MHQDVSCNARTRWVWIQVFTTEYDKARKESYLHFWKYRARLCTQVLLSPRWPWTCEGEESLCPERRPLAGFLTHAAKKLQVWAGNNHDWIDLCIESAAQVKQDQAEVQALAYYIGLTGWLSCLAAFAMSAVLFLVPIHALPCALFLGVSFVILQALCARSEFAGPEACSGRKFFLWMCHRADFDPNFFINKEVEKEQIDDVRERLVRVEAALARAEHGAETLPGAVLEGLEGLVGQLGERLGRDVGQLGARLGALEGRLAGLEHRFVQQQDGIDMLNCAP